MVSHEVLESRFQLQGSARNCGQQVVRLVTGVPLSEIEGLIRKRKGTHFEDLHKALHLFGYDMEWKPNRFRGFGADFPQLALMATRGHWCLYFMGKIYCTSRGIFPAEDAKKFGYRFTQYAAITC